MLRKDLDMGYESIGAFQDLAHSGANYKPKEAKKLLDEVQAW